MQILHSILDPLKNAFAKSQKGEERGTWFVYTIIAILLPFVSSKTSNLYRCLQTLFGFNIHWKRYYTFMASPKLPWKQLWQSLRQNIPSPETDGRILLALDDCINPKTGKMIHGCAYHFDHAAKANQSKYPWAQNIVALGLLKTIKGRWACLPLNFRFYHLKKHVKEMKKKGLVKSFQTKLEMAVEMITEVSGTFSGKTMIIIADSWFGNNGLWKPLQQRFDAGLELISRLRSNSNVFSLPIAPSAKTCGRRRKYGPLLGNASELACQFKSLAREYRVNLYGKVRTVIAYDQVVTLKTIQTMVKVVWVYRRNQWVAFFSTDPTLSVEQIIEFYGARWKIESLFKELKRDIGSADTQARNQQSVINHLNFCMIATTIAWIYASRLEKTPARRHAVSGRNHFAFSDVRRSIAKSALSDDFSRVFPVQRKSGLKSIVGALLRMAA